MNKELPRQCNEEGLGPRGVMESVLENAENEFSTAFRVALEAAWHHHLEIIKCIATCDRSLAVAADLARTTLPAAAAVRAWRQGRKVLVLTERRVHIDALTEAISQVAGGLFPNPSFCTGN